VTYWLGGAVSVDLGASHLHPRVLAAAAEFGRRVGGFVRGDAGQGAGKNLVVAVPEPERKQDVILPADRGLAILKTHGVRIAVLRLRDEMGGVLKDFRADLRELFRRGPEAVAAHQDPFPVERADGVVFQISQHHLALVDVPEPVGRKAFQDCALAEVMPDDGACEREEAAVIGELGADRVDDRDRALADAVDQAGNAEH
jgi:hypothetical protein